MRNLDTADKAELKKLQLLKDEIGDLTAADAKRYRQLRAQVVIVVVVVVIVVFVLVNFTNLEVLFDVICCFC